MTQFDIPAQIKFPKNRFEQLRNGTEGVIFRITNELAAKILFSKNNSHYELRQDEEGSDELTHESEIAYGLYKLGVAVPEPVGIERIALYDTAYPAFIMQYMPFPTGADLGFHEFEIARRLVQEELGKAVDNGFIPGGDCLNPNNYFYNRGKKEVFLIDFGRWSHENPDFLQEYEEVKENE